ncbi:MAG: Veg family protein [Firmicutes bacterium]|nr:Veg family protein [Bacillota bacterium]MCL1953775.1 Veg family protein [Bacillota bacterium]
MRKVNNSIDKVKEFVTTLEGKKLKISVNKGRKRIVKYTGSIQQLFPQVFVLNINDNKDIKSLSCSYHDVICGDIKLAEDIKTIKIDS